MMVKLGRNKTIDSDKVISMDILDCNQPNMKKIVIIYSEGPADMGIYTESECNDFICRMTKAINR